MALIVSVVAVISTLLGGLFAIRFKDKLHLILGFSAGAVIGVTLFDLLPESIELAGGEYDISLVTLLIAIGFIAFMLLDRFFSLHGHDQGPTHDDEKCENPSHNGKLGAAAFLLHSFLDGVGIGLAFKISPSIGWIVAAAVLAHGFSDGVNTVNVIFKNKGKSVEASRWLIGDAVAPALGVISTLFFTVSEASLGLLLSVFTGFFLYLGASDLIPESHHHHPTFGTTAMTILGIFVLYAAIQLAG